MLILAAEQSTTDSSAVISDNSEVIASVNWEESRIRSQQFFPKIEALLSKADTTLERIDLFATGIGPGSFNALRMCISAITSFALPSNKPVFAVSSAQALACKVANETGKSSVSVVGDARRGFLWVANCVFSDTPIPESSELIISTPENLKETVEKSEIIVSPDFDRISKALASLPNNSARLHEGTLHPDAQTVSATAFAATEAGIKSPAPLPIYVHPPV